LLFFAANLRKHLISVHGVYYYSFVPKGVMPGRISSSGTVNHGFKEPNRLERR